MRKGDIEVHIKSEGRALPEYQVEVVDDKTVACYIPSEAGKVLRSIITEVEAKFKTSQRFTVLDFQDPLDRRHTTRRLCHERPAPHRWAAVHR